MNREDRIGLACGLAVGVPLMLVGIIGLLQHTDATPPSSYLRFLVGGNLLNDLVVAPIAALIGVLLIRRAPAITRGPLRAALFGTAVVVALAWPALRGYGRDRAPDNTTVQPLNYATAVETVIVVVCIVSALWLAIALLHTRRTRTRHETM
jgi:hypothetical protein